MSYIIAFTEGSSFYGVGAGGTPESGQKSPESAVKAWREIRIIDVSSLPKKG